MSSSQKAFPSTVHETPPKEITDTPIKLNQVSPQQGIFELPDVENDDYVPINMVELSQAAYTLAKSVPPQFIEKYYRRLVKLTDQSLIWEQEEEMKEGKLEKMLRAKIQKMINEATPKLNQRGMKRRDAESFYAEEDPADLMMYDPDEDMMVPDEALAAELDADKRKHAQKAAAETPQSWSSIKFSPLKKMSWKDVVKDIEDSSSLPVEQEKGKLGDKGYQGDWNEIATHLGEKPGTIRQMITGVGRGRPRVNLMDVIRFLIAEVPGDMTEGEFKKIVVRTGAQFLEKFEQQVKASLAGNPPRNGIEISPDDPAVKRAILAFANELLTADAIDEEDAQALKSAAQHVVTLPTFKKFFLDYLDENLNQLMEFIPFREATSKMWRKMIYADDSWKDYLQKRMDADVARVAKDRANKAKAKSNKATSKKATKVADPVADAERHAGESD